MPQPILIVLGLIVFCSPLLSNAQDTNKEFRISINQSKVTRDPLDKNRFFNTTSLALEYQHELIENLNGVARVRFLQFIQTEGTSSDPVSQKLQRFTRSFLTFDAGISLIPFVISDKFEIRFSPGASLRHRNEVNTVAAASTPDNNVFVQNSYTNRWDIGGFFGLGFTYTFSSNWLIELRGQFHTFNKGSGVFDVGLSFGKKF